jgi:hypothetical protein
MRKSNFSPRLLDAEVAKYLDRLIDKDLPRLAKTSNNHADPVPVPVANNTKK